MEKQKVDEMLGDDEQEVLGEVEPGDVQAESVNITQGSAQNVEAQSVIVNQGGIAHVDADEVSVRQGGVGYARAEAIDVTQGGVGLAQAEEVTIMAGGAVAVVGADVTIDAGGAQWVLARNSVDLEQAGVVVAAAPTVNMTNSIAGVILARNVNGNVRVMFDQRAAVVFGIAAGIVMGLILAAKRNA